jgi:hypothetical protein
MKSIENTVGSHDYLSPNLGLPVIDRQAQSLTRVCKYLNTDGLYGKIPSHSYRCSAAAKSFSVIWIDAQFQRRFRQTEKMAKLPSELVTVLANIGQVKLFCVTECKGKIDSNRPGDRELGGNFVFDRDRPTPFRLALNR